MLEYFLFCSCSCGTAKMQMFSALETHLNETINNVTLVLIN